MTPLWLDPVKTTRHDSGMLIYKIFRQNEWAELQEKSETPGAPMDVADGYIHFSTAETVAETAEKYFSDAGDLVLCAVEADDLDLIKWEPAREGVLFPHLYRNIRLNDIVWTKPLRFENGAHVFPDFK